MTLTTVGYGDISADNTGERAGYVLFFIVGAFIWGNLLAEVGEIHQTSSARQHEEMERIQTMLEFLMDNDCPSQLRTEIIQWTRYATCVLSSGLTLSQGLLLFLMLFRLSCPLPPGLPRPDGPGADSRCGSRLIIGFRV